MRVAIIGISGFGRHHYADLVELASQGRVQLKAATVINQAEEPERCETLRSYDCEVYDDYHDMLSRSAGGIDLVVIPTGIHLHAPMTVDCLKAGCHVLVEKPVAATLGEWERMKEVELKTGRFVAVGFQHIYNRAAQDIKRLLLQDRIGERKRIEILGLWPRPDSYWSRNAWAGKIKLPDQTPVYDAPFNNAFSHFLNLALFFAGSTFGTSATSSVRQARAWRVRPIQSCDTVSVQALLDESIACNVHLTHACSKNQSPRIFIEGTKGTLEWDTESRLRLTTEDGKDQLKMPAMRRSRIWDALIDVNAGGTDLICDLGIAGAQLRLAHQIFGSQEIRTLSAREEISDDGEIFRVIPGIEEVFEAAYREGTPADMAAYPMDQAQSH